MLGSAMCHHVVHLQQRAILVHTSLLTGLHTTECPAMTRGKAVGLQHTPAGFAAVCSLHNRPKHLQMSLQPTRLELVPWSSQNASKHRGFQGAALEQFGATNIWKTANEGLFTARQLDRCQVHNTAIFVDVLLCLGMTREYT